MPERPPAGVLVAVGLIAGTTLALQVLLTRVFSAALFYHFGFLAISLALLGTGAGAILVYLRPGWFEGPFRPQLARWSAALAGLLVAVPFVLVRLDYTFPNEITVRFALTLAAASVLAAGPFFVAGVVIALAITRYTRWIGRVYAFDLAGAGLGALAVVPVLWLVAAPPLIAVLGAIAAGAAILLAGTGPGLRGALAAGALALAAVALSGPLDLYRLPPILYGPGAQSQTLQVDRWTPLSRVVAYSPRGDVPYGLLYYDRDYAPVPRYERGTPFPDWRDLSLGPQSVGYELTGPGHALIIGGGGGRDIFNALASGQRRVDVIELNQAIRDAVDDDLGAWSGSPYSLPRVRTTIGDGRSALAARDTKYDQVHIGFTNTISANSAQAFALTENNLYTVEAFDEYLDHLRPDGVLNVSRVYHLVGDEALRATVLTLAALRERGVEDPERNVVVVLGRDYLTRVLFGTILARNRPFTAAELATVRRLGRERGAGVAFAPGGPYYREWAQLARAPSPEAFCEGYRLNVCPPTDDRPFFFNMQRLGDVGLSASSEGYLYSIDPFAVLLVVLGVLTVLSLLAFVGPLVLVREAGRPPWSALAFFAAIGVGYLVLEVGLIQRFVLFLGFPTYALSIVLFSLLVFTGLGALLSNLPASPRRALTLSLGAAAAMIAAVAFGLGPLLEALVGLPFAARVAVTVALLAPLGAVLGMAMPIGLRRLSVLHPRGVAWAWGINGITSVLASVLAVSVAIAWGFTVTTLLALAAYLGALAHAALGRWPAEGQPPEDRGPEVAEPVEVGAR
ncbi:MAG TPA: hypothetical protein VNB64_13175 [Solirubrobacteraceae bacterium]|nr:hypothetical protein [Solirubrobacteraceae bacterium]